VFLEYGRDNLRHLVGIGEVECDVVVFCVGTYWRAAADADNPPACVEEI
jgi:hypothetical protein